MRRLVAIAGVVAAACLPAAAAAQDHTVVWAVGDSQAESPAGLEPVASLIQNGGLDRLLFLGDLNENGTAREYAEIYGPTFGRMKDVTSPTIGNHDWPRRAQGYDAYWGPSVRQPDGSHWYSFDLGGWHFISLSSMEELGTSSAQLAWLRQDLARYPGTCTVAFSHYPRYSAGPQWSNSSHEPFWQALRGHAVLYLSGHAHNYQRHKPVRGITQFVVGTSGGTLSNPDYWDPRLASKAGEQLGALRMELALGGARFGFVTPDRGTIDDGDLACVPHTPTPATVRVQRPRSNAAYRSLRTLYGTARNALRVRLTLVRRIGGRCLAWDGRSFRGASCTTRLGFAPTTMKPPPFPGAGTSRWKHRLPSAATLAPGRYRLDVRVRALDKSLSTRSASFTIRR